MSHALNQAGSHRQALAASLPEAARATPDDARAAAGFHTEDSLSAVPATQFAGCENFASHDWYLNFERTVPLADNARYRYFASTDGEGVPLMLPCVVQNKRLAGLTHTIIRSMSSECSFWHAPMARPGYSAAAVERCLTEALRREGAQHLELYPLRAGSVELQGSIDAIRKAGWAYRQPLLHHNCFHRVAESFEEYFAQRPERVRSILARKSKKFWKAPGARIEIVCDEQDIERHTRAFFAVEDGSWKPAETLADLKAGIIRLSARRGELRMGIAYLDDMPVAVHVYIVSAGVANIFNSSYTESHKSYSPGAVLMHALMRHVVDIDGVQELDFGIGAHAYKMDWMSEQRELYKLVAFDPRTAIGLAGIASAFHVDPLRERLRGMRRN